MSIVDATFQETDAPSNLATSTPVAQRMDVDAFILNANDFETIKARLLQPAGAYTNSISGKDCVNTNGWQRIASALQISTEIISLAGPNDRGARREVLEDVKGKKIVAFSVTVRAAFGGRYQEAMGRCDTTETKHAQNEHKLESVAHTRAKNRAICALVGGSPSDIAEEQEDRVQSARKEAETALPSGPAQVAVVELQRLHAAANMPDGSLREWITRNIPGFGGRGLTAPQSLLARDLLIKRITSGGEELV